MELVYLWVEEYKNIKNHGFHFSPKFNCHYDGETLTIKKNIDNKGKKQYIENFFGDNINITAIVGKNGSGKSNILKFIRKIIGKEIDDGSFLIFYNKLNNTYNCVYTTNKINANIELIQTKEMDSNIIFPLFDYSLTYDNSMSFKNEQLPVYPKKEKSFLDFHRELITNQKNILNNYNNLKEKQQLNKFKDFFQPDKIKILFDLEKLKAQEEKLVEKEIPNYKKIINNFEGNKSLEEAIKLIEVIFEFLSKKEYFKDKWIEIEEILNNNVDIKLEYEERKEEFFKLTHGDNNNLLRQELHSLEQKNHNSYASGYSGSNIWDNDEYYKLFFDKNKLNIIEKEDKLYCLFNFDIKEFSNKFISIIYDSFPLEYFKIELIDIYGKKLNNLSFGEQFNIL